MIARADYNFIVKYGEVTPDGVAVYDLNSRAFVYMNRFLLEMLGMVAQADPHPGDELARFVHPEDVGYVDQRYRELLSIGCIPPVDFRIIHPINGIRHMSLEVLWLEESYTFAIFARDITVLRQYEDYVEKISAQKDTLLDILLHNLSGPLYFSRDVLKKISVGDSPAEDMSRLLTMVMETNSQCIDIINQFLQDEHTESLQVVVRSIRFSATEKTTMIIRMLSETHRQKKISLQSSLPDEHIVADVVKFCQVVHNLLSNSVKYTDDAGTVAVHLARGKHGTVIRVSDDGPGVPDRIVPDLFKRKVKGTTGRHGEPSRGMGLFICARLVKLMGGELKLETTGPEGSVFTLFLPDQII